MTASVVYLQHALVPSKRRVEHVQPRSIRSLAPGWDRPHIALVNGQAVLRKDWDRHIHHGEVLAFVDVEAIPQGGGGGSNPLRMILMIAVMVMAPEIAWGIEGMLGASGMAVGATGLMAIQAGVTMVGMALVNALIPPPKPPTPHQAAGLAAPSPTYSLQAQGNQARLEGAIPEHFGRMVAYPDFAAQPYQEYAGNEQYLYQLLCIGRGEYDIEAIRIEDTPISSFDEIEYEVVQPNGTLTLFPSNVVSSTEVSGQDLPCISGTYSQSGTTTITVTATGHGLATGKNVYLDFTSGTAMDGTFAVATAADADHFTVTAGAAATTSGNVTVSTWIGAFVATAPETQANYIGIDLVLPRGLYKAESSGKLSNVSLTVAYEAQAIDDAGTPTGSWTALGSQTITAATTTPQRNSYRHSVTPGRYQVRARRVDVKQTDTTYGHEVAWAGLRSYLPDTRTFGDVTLLAMRMRASNNLSMQASRKINVICTRKLPIWNGSTWSANTATRSISWAFAYACKQVGVLDAQLDLATLLTLDATWAARGDYFDARFDGFISFWESITKIAGAGRAKPYMQGGVVRIMRDQAVTIPVALFSMRNIERGSFSVNYLMPTADTADAIDVGYFDGNVWAPRRVRAMLTGSTAEKPTKVELFGVTGRQHAFREGMYQAASNRYRRKIIKFSTEMEGFIPSYGDLIAIQHDMPAWGQHAEVTAWDSATNTLTLTEPLTWGTGTHYIALRKRDGSVDGPFSVTAGAAENQVVLGTSPTFTPYTGGAEERTHVTFGWASTWSQLAKVIAIRPRGLYSVEIEAVGEDPSVHTAEDGLLAPAAQSSQLANYTNSPLITGLIAQSMPGAPEKMLLTWQASPWADHYLIEQSSDGVAWTRTGETSTSNYTATSLYGSSTIIRIAAVGLAKGPWVTVMYGAAADYMWNAVDTTLMWNVTDTTEMWRY